MILGQSANFLCTKYHIMLIAHGKLWRYLASFGSWESGKYIQTGNIKTSSMLCCILSLSWWLKTLCCCNYRLYFFHGQSVSQKNDWQGCHFVPAWNSLNSNQTVKLCRSNVNQGSVTAVLFCFFCFQRHFSVHCLVVMLIWKFVTKLPFVEIKCVKTKIPQTCSVSPPQQQWFTHVICILVVVGFLNFE